MPNIHPKIAILGPVPYYNITNWKNESIDRYGTITYPVIALSKLFGENAHIVPVTHVRQKDEQTVKTLLRGYSGVELQHINSDQDQGDVVRMRFVDPKKALEKQYAFMNPITPHDVKNILDFNIFAFIPIADYEISLETLIFIKQYSKGQVVFDGHGQTMAMTSLGDRVPKFWIDRDLWLPYIDVLILNREDAYATWFSHEYTFEELEQSQTLGETEQKALAKHILSKGPKALYLTLEDEGCIVFTMKNGELHSKKVPAVSTELTVTTIGCGDAFVGGVVFGLLHTKNDYEKTAEYANAIASQRCNAESYDAFLSIEETEKLVRGNYKL
ncbi:MAG: PfkB family carbohydrate kinase [Gammaproteobacteria bacterium]